MKTSPSSLVVSSGGRVVASPEGKVVVPGNGGTVGSGGAVIPAVVVAPASFPSSPLSPPSSTIVGPQPMARAAAIVAHRLFAGTFTPRSYHKS